MALTPGTRLGVYEVTAQIGEGGMGQVFRATDTKLKRQVAIKILSPSLAADHDRLARFQREAEVLASLNHPNIAAIYGLEESAGMTALVMELVEGEDLSQRIARGAVPIDKTLLIARQIAEALEAAHEQGVIHRDLKPANIKLREDGTVKVLDFGLAKAMEPAGAMTASASMSPTMLSPAITQVGLILGTAAYMSPEQARGRTVDRRADVWAFGAVLFEMLTGNPPFPGENISHVLARVIERDPEWSALPPALPPALGTYLRRCLVKDPRQRIRDIGDVRLALEGAFETSVPVSCPRDPADFGGGTRPAVGDRCHVRRCRKRMGADVGTVARADAGGSSAGTAGRRPGRGCFHALCNHRPECSWDQRSHLPGWDAVGLRIGHSQKAVHAATGSTESH